MLKLIGSIFLMLASEVWALDSYYCPQRTGYIKLGMTEAEVISACGEPLSKKKADKPLSRKIPVKQMVYNNQGATKAFFGVWALPIGNSTNTTQGLPAFGASGGPTGGSQLEVNIVNNKVSSVILNGADTKGFSICGGARIDIGDSVGKVNAACGQPTSVNNSYIDEEIPSTTQPEIWVYQPKEFEPAISLTFIDGKLQSIN